MTSPGSTLVVGARGLVGSALVRALEHRDGVRPTTIAVPWHDPRAATLALQGSARALTAHDDWRVFWCAGAGVNGMTADDAGAEVAQVASFLDGLPGTGLVFVASSAGGVYGGAVGAPFDEHTPPRTVSHYGSAKLGVEDAVRDWAARTGGTAVVGRLSNVYGPGQDVTKPQGLISHLCLGAVRRRPVSIYVPLDTRRDYLYVRDAAELVLDTVAAAPVGSATTKVLCSQQSVTVATLIADVRAVARRHVPILLGDSPLRAGQTADLRLRSTVLPAVDRRTITPIAVGIAETMRDMSARVVRLSPGR
jgi:UDP-glucose 4-epimerase